MRFSFRLRWTDTVIWCVQLGDYAVHCVMCIRQLTHPRSRCWCTWCRHCPSWGTLRRWTESPRRSCPGSSDSCPSPGRTGTTRHARATPCSTRCNRAYPGCAARDQPFQVRLDSWHRRSCRSACGHAKLCLHQWSHPAMGSRSWDCRPDISWSEGGSPGCSGARDDHASVGGPWGSSSEWSTNAACRGSLKVDINHCYSSFVHERNSRQDWY